MTITDTEIKAAKRHAIDTIVEALGITGKTKTFAFDGEGLHHIEVARRHMQQALLSLQKEDA
jgi:hypothetical protein